MGHTPFCWFFTYLLKDNLKKNRFTCKNCEKIVMTLQPGGPDGIFLKFVGFISNFHLAERGHRKHSPSNIVWPIQTMRGVEWTNFVSVTFDKSDCHCQFSQFATAQNLLLARGATLDALHHPVMSHEAAVRNRAGKKMLFPWKKPLVLFVVLLLKWKKKNCSVQSNLSNSSKGWLHVLFFSSFSHLYSLVFKGGLQL